MNHYITRAGSLVLFAIFCGTLIPNYSVEAASRPSYSDYYRNSQEGNVSATTLDRGTSHRGISSAAQKAIDKLDDDPVTDLPIPVLLGVSLSDISPNFGDPRDGGTRTHEGEDILAPRNDYIVSPTDAVVTSMGTGVSAGNYVYTANPGDETFAFMHLDAFAEGLKVGTVLEKGDLIGYVGDTGDAKGGVTHLHFEIRHGKTATDPFPRLTKTFTLEERIDAVTKALKDADDEDKDAAMLVANYRSTFVSAKAQGIDLPKSIDNLLGTTATTVITSGTFPRDLTIGSRGDDVTTLQTLLMGGTGAAAQALNETGATGYFGALTQAALAEYQLAHAISPAAGYFGPITRTYIASH